jgi:hypothetical protein
MAPVPVSEDRFGVEIAPLCEAKGRRPEIRQATWIGRHECHVSQEEHDSNDMTTIDRLPRNAGPGRRRQMRCGSILRLATSSHQRATEIPPTTVKMVRIAIVAIQPLPAIPPWNAASGVLAKSAMATMDGPRQTPAIRPSPAGTRSSPMSPGWSSEEQEPDPSANARCEPSGVP